MELCIGIQAALACLAILSRIHFSKYKRWRYQRAETYPGGSAGIAGVDAAGGADACSNACKAAGLDNHCNPVCKYLYRGGTTV